MPENGRLEGGLRIRGLFNRESTPDRPLVSIITVCRNSEKYLEQTIQSIINQTYDNIEYIIIDGASTDGTLDIICKYNDYIAYWVSEPDKGIYDAMNKGSKIASGDYALYLNSDDYLYHNDSIEKTFLMGLQPGEYPYLIAGQIRFALDDQLLDWVWPTNERMLYKYSPRHQAVFIYKTIYKKVFYNSFFKSAGDYDFWLKLQQQGLLQIKYIDNIISVFRLGGISNNIKVERLKYIEHEIIRYINQGSFSILRVVIKSVILVTIKKTLFDILGKNIYYKYVFYGVNLFRKWVS